MVEEKLYATDSIEVALKHLKECQVAQGTTSCVFCVKASQCAQKEEFENAVMQNLSGKQIALKECQRKRNCVSCLSCAEVLECQIRHSYVNAVYLSMNKGNGGSFEF